MNQVQNWSQMEPSVHLTANLTQNRVTWDWAIAQIALAVDISVELLTDVGGPSTLQTAWFPREGYPELDKKANQEWAHIWASKHHSCML